MQAVNLLPEYARPGRRWTTAGSELSSRRILPIGGTAAVALRSDLRAALLPRADRSSATRRASSRRSRRASSPSRRAPSRSSRRRRRARRGSTFMRTRHRRRAFTGTRCSATSAACFRPACTLTTSRRPRSDAGGRSGRHHRPSRSSVPRTRMFGSRSSSTGSRCCRGSRTSRLQSTTRSGTTVTFSIGATLRRRRRLVIDRMSGRISLLLVSGRAVPDRLARLVRARSRRSGRRRPSSTPRSARPTFSCRP